MARLCFSEARFQLTNVPRPNCLPEINESDPGLKHPSPRRNKRRTSHRSSFPLLNRYRHCDCCEYMHLCRHNMIGLCVALPIYYASGNRVKGFLWALLSGASEFIAALLGWAILANVFSETAYGILFGLVAGMMIMISTRELLPTAHIYDKSDTVVSYSFIVGMVVMALSLCLFKL